LTSLVKIIGVLCMILSGWCYNLGTRIGFRRHVLYCVRVFAVCAGNQQLWVTTDTWGMWSLVQGEPV